MNHVQLFSVDRGGFRKTITATMRNGALMVSSHAFDTEGYDREYDITVEAPDIAQLAKALELRRASKRQILNALRGRFGSLAGEAKFERFLSDQDIPAIVGGYTSMP